MPPSKKDDFPLFAWADSREKNTVIDCVDIFEDKFALFYFYLMRGHVPRTFPSRVIWLAERRRLRSTPAPAYPTISVGGAA